MRGAPWMVSSFYEESFLTDPTKWATIRTKCTSVGQTLLASPLQPAELPKRPTYLDDDISILFSHYDPRIPINDQHVRSCARRSSG